MYSLNGLATPSGILGDDHPGWVLGWRGAGRDGNVRPLIAYPTRVPGWRDKGLQRITIVATSSDGQATETVQVLKRAIA